MSLEIFILGTGGMMPLPNRSLTSVLVRREGDLFLFDSGEGTQISLRKLNLKWKKISGVFVSHTHADHVTGLPGIMMLTSQVERDEPLYITGPPKIREYVESSRKILDMFINYEIVIEEIREEKIVFETEELSIKAFPLHHSKPCMGYVLEEKMRPGVFHPERAEALGVPRGPLWSKLQRGEKVILADGRTVLPEEIMGPKRRGRKFSFVTDTAYVKTIAGYVKDSDLLICEGMFMEELADSAYEKKHLTAKQAAQIALEANVGRLGLIHYSPRYTERDLKALLREAKKIFPETFLTRDLQIINLPNT